jgi:hypothetical protein
MEKLHLRDAPPLQQNYSVASPISLENEWHFVFKTPDGTSLPSLDQGKIFGDLTIASAMIDRSSTTPTSSASRATATGSENTSPRPVRHNRNEQLVALFSTGTNGPVLGWS